MEEATGTTFSQRGKCSEVGLIQHFNHLKVWRLVAKGTNDFLRNFFFLYRFSWCFKGNWKNTITNISLRSQYSLNWSTYYLSFVDNTNTDLKVIEIWCQGELWIRVADDRAQWRAIVNTQMKLRFPLQVVNLLIRWATTSFSGMTLIHEI